MYRKKVALAKMLGATFHILAFSCGRRGTTAVVDEEFNSLDFNNKLFLCFQINDSAVVNISTLR